MSGFPAGYVSSHMENANTGGGFVGGDQTPVEMWENQGTQESAAPRCLAVINGQVYTVQRAVATINAYGVLDTCEFDCTIQNNPDFTKTIFQGETDTSAVPLTLYFGFTSTPNSPVTIAQLSPIFIGQGDKTHIDHRAGIVEFTGRSLGVILTDKRLTTPIQYQTSAQLISDQAQKNGLTPIIILAPGQQAVQMATVFSREFVAGVKNFRVWDLITQCTQYDDTDAWVDGYNLYYVSPVYVPRNNITLTIGKDIDLENLTADHSFQYNRKILVEVRTYQPRSRSASLTRLVTHADGSVTEAQVQRTSVSNPVFGTRNVNYTTYSYNETTGAYTLVSGSSSSSGGNFGSSTRPEENSGIERYTVYPQSPLTPQQNVDLAESTWRRLSMHEWSIEATVPCTPANLGQILRTTLFTIAGSPYQLVNQQYWPRRMSWNFTLDAGAKWVVEAVNHQLPLGQA